ncbi:RING-type E3 ubiquitin transferase [Salvia divinorum]
MKWSYFAIPHGKEAKDFVVHQLDAHTVRQTVCSSDPDAECAVCLCGIAAGDQIRRLRCSHVFHAACFDRWIGCGRWTCPLCRNHLTNIPGSDDTRRQILLSGFAHVASSGNKDNWWLR